MSEKKIDFDVPFILEALFKYQEVDINGDREQAEPVGEPIEKVQEIACLWFDIVELKTYVYDDSEWSEANQGDKFYIVMRESGIYLVKGNFKQMFNLWKQFCKEYYGKNSNS
jgi:hypothetical protein